MMANMARIPGEGLAKGLAVTLRHMLRKSETRQYPEVRPELPARSRGVIALVEENCTVCMLCARECPDWCIYIDSHKETLPAPEGGRPRARNVLDRFAIDFSLCMYCGICIEVCPFDALFWSPEFEYAEYDIRDLLHEKDRLASWVETVPPPPAHEPNAEPPKEAAAATRPARTTGPPGRAARPPGGATHTAAHAAVRGIRPPGALNRPAGPASEPTRPAPEPASSPPEDRPGPAATEPPAPGQEEGTAEPPPAGSSEQGEPDGSPTTPPPGERQRREGGEGA
jgi:formate hydrogenlyase subunit 6/NADH:ubiquinone oxidoreductase subunit I